MEISENLYNDVRQSLNTCIDNCKEVEKLKGSLEVCDEDSRETVQGIIESLIEDMESTDPENYEKVIGKYYKKLCFIETWLKDMEKSLDRDFEVDYQVNHTLERIEWAKLGVDK